MNTLFAPSSFRFRTPRCALLVVLLLTATAAFAQTYAYLKPTIDVGANNNIVGSPDTQLYKNIDDGTVFGASDGDTTHIRTAGGVANCSYTAGYSGAPAGFVTAVNVNHVVRRGSTSGTVQVKLYNKNTLIGTAPVRTLASTYTNYTEVFNGLSGVVSANDLRTELVFVNTSGPPPTLSLRCTQLWIRATVHNPFFMFAQSADSAALDVIELYFDNRDYISKLVATARPTLQTGNGITDSHVFRIPASLAALTTAAQTLCSSSTPGLLLYDIEHWTATPPAEQAQPGQSINSGANIIANSGCPSLLTYGTTPDGQFHGLTPPPGCPSHTFANSIFKGLGGDGGTQEVDWTKVSFIIMQLQRLVNEDCLAGGEAAAIANYVSINSQAISYLKGLNPSMIVVAQVSLRFTPPASVISAIQQVAPLVDGIYLTYPDPGQDYCTPANLQTVLAAFRP